MRIFIGFDVRQPLAYNIARASIERHASGLVDIQPLRLEHLPVKRCGLTQFSFSRYVVPYLCGYAGEALFMDSDVVVLGDVLEIPKVVTGEHAVYVSKNKLKFEWPSVMFFRNGKCSNLSLDMIENGKPHLLEWASSIGDLPPEWNHLVGYDVPKPAKLVHFTQGIPCWPETKGCEYSDEWWEEFKHMTGTVSWQALMGKSVHAAPVLERLAKQAA